GQKPPALHGLVAAPEDNPAGEATYGGFFGVENPRRRGLIVALGDDAHLDAVDAAGLERNRRGPELVELAEACLEDLGKARFAHAPGAQNAALDHGCLPGAAPQVGQDGAEKHLVQFVGYAGRGIVYLVAHRADEPRGCARHLRNWAGAD